MSEVNRYKYWLKLVSKKTKLGQKVILRSWGGSQRTAWQAKQVFYALCLRDNINLYELSLALGKHRTTVLSSVKKAIVNKELLNKVLEYAKNRDSQKTA